MNINMLKLRLVTHKLWFSVMKIEFGLHIFCFLFFLILFRIDEEKPITCCFLFIYSFGVRARMLKVEFWFSKTEERNNNEKEKKNFPSRTKRNLLVCLYFSFFLFNMKILILFFCQKKNIVYRNCVHSNHRNDIVLHIDLLLLTWLKLPQIKASLDAIVLKLQFGK